MSFVFPSWETAFSPSFYDDAKAMLETALNKGNKPPVIQGRIEVVDLNMGSQVGSAICGWCELCASVSVSLLP